MSISRRTTPHLIGLGELEEELVIAREIQFSILPESMPQVPGYDLAGLLRPANHTGGDMFDLVSLNQGLFVLLGDATGHGAGPGWRWPLSWAFPWVLQVPPPRYLRPKIALRTGPMRSTW